MGYRRMEVGWDMGEQQLRISSKRSKIQINYCSAKSSLPKKKEGKRTFVSKSMDFIRSKVCEEKGE